jgi:hypothetical protein
MLTLEGASTLVAISSKFFPASILILVGSSQWIPKWKGNGLKEYFAEIIFINETIQKTKENLIPFKMIPKSENFIK